MAVLKTIILDPGRGTEADLHDDGSVRLWAGRGMTGAQAWGLKPKEAHRLVAAYMANDLTSVGSGWLASNLEDGLKAREEGVSAEESVSHIPLDTTHGQEWRVPKED